MRHILTQAVLKYAKTGNDKHGKPTFATSPVSVRVRFREKSTYLRKAGETVTRSFGSLLSAVGDFAKGDKFTYGGSAYQVIEAKGLACTQAEVILDRVGFDEISD